MFLNTWKGVVTDDVTWSVCASIIKSSPLDLPDLGVRSNLVLRYLINLPNQL